MLQAYERGIRRHATARRRLRRGGDPRRDQLPLRHLRQRLDALQLIIERSDAYVARERGVVPCRNARWKITREVIEAHLLRGLAQILAELPRLGLMSGSTPHDEARAPGDRLAARPAIGAGKGSGCPRVLERRR